METNKIVGAICSTLLVFLGLGFFAELLYHPHEEHELAFALAAEESGGEEAAEEVDLTALFAAASVAEGEKVFKKCAACHKLEEGANGVGPTLYSIVNRDVGSIAGFNYSGALPADEKWTPEHLFHFLENPKKVHPGTSMGFAGLKKAEDRVNIIAYLNEDDGSPDPLP